MKRFFYGGCSYTQYAYPTWGDILAYDKLNHKGYDFAFNLAISGGCNQLIASRFAWADKKYKFTAQDEIAVLWTSLFRESVLGTWNDEPDSHWHAYGNSFNNHLWSEVTNQPYLHNTYNMLDRNMTTMHYVEKLYKPFFQGRIGSHDNADDLSYDQLCENDVVNRLKYQTLDSSLEEFYNGYLALPRFDNYPLPSDLHNDIFSAHPNIKAHLNYAMSITDLDDSTISYFEKLYNDIQEMLNKVSIDSNYYQQNKHEYHNQVSKFCSDIFLSPGWENIWGIDISEVHYS